MKVKCYLVVTGAKQGTITSNTDTRNGDTFLGNKLVSAAAFGKIPNTDCSIGITANELSLVGMDDDIVDSSFVHVVALLTASAGIPDFDGPILRAGNHPLSLTMESNTRDIPTMTLEGHHGVGVRRLDVEQLDMVTSSCSKETLIGGDTQAVDLRFGMLDVAGADTGEGLPEAAGRCQH